MGVTPAVNVGPTKLPRHVWLALGTVLWAAAAGPILIRMAQSAGLPSLYIIAARLLLTNGVLAPAVLQRQRGEILRMRRRDWLHVTAAGLLLATNLMMLFLSLENTSVLMTTVLRRTSPLWVIWLEVAFLGAVFTRRVWIGLLLTLVGAALVGAGSASGASAVMPGGRPLLGAALALVGAVCVGLYLVVGRAVRQRMSSLTYNWLVFLLAGVFAGLAVLIMRVPLTGYGWAGLGWIVAVTAVTQFMGHIPINASLRYIPATFMSLVMQLAVALGAVMAFFAFGEAPSALQIAGSAAIMVGVLVASMK